MFSRVLAWAIAVGVLVSIVTVISLAKEREEGVVFITGNGPITEDQVRQKMTTDGCTNVLISREGRFFQVVGSKDQQTAHLVVDSQTGRLRGDDNE